MDAVRARKVRRRAMVSDSGRIGWLEKVREAPLSCARALLPLPQERTACSCLASWACFSSILAWISARASSFQAEIYGVCVCAREWARCEREVEQVENAPRRGVRVASGLGIKEVAVALTVHHSGRNKLRAACAAGSSQRRRWRAYAAVRTGQKKREKTPLPGVAGRSPSAPQLSRQKP